MTDHDAVREHDALDDDYAQAGFGLRLGFGARPVVLVVDMVKAYLDKGSPLYAGVESALEATVALVEAARAADVAVIFTKVGYDDASQGGLFYRKARGLSLFVGDGELSEVADELQRRDSEPLMRKQFASAFFGTTLWDDLQAAAIDTVLITGLSTSGCVRATAVDAVQLGVIPVVVREAVGDRSPLPHEQSLFDLEAKYADVVSLEEAISYLAGGAAEATRLHGGDTPWPSS